MKKLNYICFILLGIFIWLCFVIIINKNNLKKEKDEIAIITNKDINIENNFILKNNKYIYLTFDDGPSYSITAKILDILKEENVKATFFVINHSDDLNFLIKREYDEGHTVGLHSYTHVYKTIYNSVDNYFKDLNFIKEKVDKITGGNANIVRFPGGTSNTISRRYSKGIMTKLTSELKNRNFYYFDWNISSGDANGKINKNRVYRNVVNNLRYTHNVVLMHDFENNYGTLNALKDIIKYGKENGYIFLALTDKVPAVHHKSRN